MIMLRLAHRILSQEIYRTVNERVDAPTQQRLKERLSRSMCIIADNVAAFYAEHEQQEWDVTEDFSGVHPPSDSFFVEWNCPPLESQNIQYKSREGDAVRENRHVLPLQFGALVATMDSSKLGKALDAGRNQPILNAMETLLDKHKESTKWLFASHPVAAAHNGQAYILPWVQVIAVNGAGTVLEWFAVGNPPMFPDGTPDAGILHELLLTLTFMSCKNVARRDATETEGPPDKWLRRQKQPKLRYHVLEIDPMREVLRREGGIETNGLKKALHICRGHFATYTEERPLFGRQAGTFWVPQHTRGNAKHGVVVKDYAVKVGEAAK